MTDFFFFFGHTHLLQKCVQNGALLSHVLLLQGLSEVIQGNAGAIGPQMGVKTPFSYLHMLIYQAEQLVTLWGKGPRKLCMEIRFYCCCDQGKELSVN